MSTNPGSSKSFGALKDIKERLKDNLTTSQLLTAYDDILDRMLLPVVRETLFVDTYLIRILGWQEKHHRRKVSFLKRREVPRIIATYLLSLVDGKEEAFKELRLDRGVRMQIAEAFLGALLEYRKACSLDGYSIEESIRVKSEYEKSFGTSNLYTIYSDVQFWYLKAIEFKDMIQQKYIRMTIMAARRDHQNLFNNRVPLDDVVHQYVLTCSRAVDKCDSRAGTLTTHIQNWLFTGREAITKQKATYSTQLVESKESGESFTDDGELEVYEDNKSSEEAYVDNTGESNTVVDDILFMARIGDPIGAGRAYLGIPEVLSPAEIEILKSEST